MNIGSYNITDVTYHYIGLRVLDGMPSTSKRTEQIKTVASNVLKFVSDRNQTLMVAAPGTSYQGTAKKDNCHAICYPTLPLPLCWQLRKECRLSMPS